ncbi:MAG: flavin reductase family protein, partial [Thermoflexales bacterium]|nr:flavin reductase family protein [Thermoflexales bacterium]
RSIIHSRMVSSDVFKQVMRRWASTVTIVTARADETIYGLTATAFTPLNAEPPEVLVCIGKRTRTHPLIEQGGVFCVNFLVPEMRSLSERFAGRRPHEARFEGVRFRSEATGAPVLSDALAYLDCRVVRALDAGEHTIFIGRVEAAEVQRPEDMPLLYFNSHYHTLGERLE